MKIIIYISILLTASILGGCSLDEEPYGFISRDNFYKTEEDAHSALIYAYAVLPEIEYYSRNFIALTEIPTGNISIKPDGGASNWELQELRPRPDNAEATTAFRYAYIGINRANSLLAYVPEIQMDEATKNRILGEAYFLRALHYFNLVRLFGDVPLRTTPITAQSEAFTPISSMEEIYAVIIQDLETATELMGDSENVTRLHGRADKVAVWALLSKVYVTLASGKDTGSPGYDFVTDAEEMYGNAAIYADKVISDQSVYGFDNDINNIFNASSEDGPEHIFSVSLDASGELEGNFSKLPLMFMPALGGNFTLQDGTEVMQGWNHFITEPLLYNSFEVGDLRKTELIVSEVTYNDQPLVLGINDWSRPFTRKYLDPARIGDKTSTNTPVIRYSDILLVYAEAVGATPEGYAAIDKIRERADIDPLPSGLSNEAFREAVILERAWELAFEGQRLFDLRRTNKMEEMATANNVADKMNPSTLYFFEIPQVEMDVNTAL